jgi:mannose/fructose/N-acetylgalactosamine-specific phosphotransferase system component IID
MGAVFQRNARKNRSQQKFEKEIFEKPIKLLEIIKKNCLNYQEHRYEMSIILDSIKKMVNTKQKENESLQDYIKQFKTTRHVMKAHVGGPLILTKVC